MLYKYGTIPNSAKKGLISIIALLSVGISITFAQIPVQTSPEIDQGKAKQETHQKPEIYGLGNKLTSRERQVLQVLTQQERRKMEEPQPFEVIGVVRNIPNLLSIDRGPKSATPSGTHLGGGLLIETTDQKAVWTTYIRSHGANALRVFLADGYLPRGCTVYLYNDAGESYGPYLFEGSIPEGGFWSNIIFSDHAYIEVQISEPALDSLHFIQLTIPEILHIEHPSFDLNNLVPCLEDVNCSYANGFSGIGNLRSATARIYFVDGGIGGWCSGGLLSDQRPADFQPFFLTANHCFSTQAAAQTVVALFDYRTTSCNGSVNPNTSQVLEANLCRTNANTDFTLVLLEAKPSAPRTYLGWTTASISDGTVLHSVHHPNAGPQKYTRAEKNTPLIGCRFTGLPKGSYHYTRVLGGPTLGGSSGGVIVNASSQAIGQLYGKCGTPNPDECAYSTYHNVWGRFDQSYNNNNLSFWLSSGALARISVSPTSLNFGNRDIGSSTDFTVTITNTSTTSDGLNLEAGTSYISGTNANQFSIVGSTSFYIPSGQSRTLTVRFTPTSAGSKTATLNIPHNASNTSSPVTVSLTGTGNNPVPSITSLSPSSRTAGGPAFTLTVNGSGYVSTSVVRWNGSDRTTTFVSSTQLTASITASDIATAGTATVTVFNPTPGGGTSGGLSFSINNPVPSATSLSPSSATAGGAAFTLTVSGSNFVSGSKVRWNGSDRTTNYVSSTQLTASITASDIATSGTATVTVFNPTPGGGTSGGLSFSINNPVPSAASLSPSSATAGGAAFTLTVSGSNFVSGSKVRWNGSDRTTNYVSSTQLTASITASDIATAGTAAVTVFNAAPGGGTSGSSTFTINNPAPSITSLSPSSATAGGPAFILTVNGSGYVSTSVVRWNGSNRTTTFVSSTQLTASITASDIATAGTASVTVFNTTPGGGTSSPSQFTINNPIPTITTLAPNNATAGGSAFTLTLNGTNFVNGSVVKWNGSDRTTTYVSSTQITASIIAADITSAGTANVTVFNTSPGGGTSSPSQFTVNNPAPTLTSILPTSGNRTQTLDVVFTGTNYISGVSTVSFGADITVNTTTVNSSTQITANITIGASASTGARNVSVTNASPGGGTATLTNGFTVNNPVPTLTSILPTSGNRTQTLDVVFTGTYFISGVTSVNVGSGITVNSTNVTSSTSLTANLTISASATTGSRNFSVTNSTPGGGTSGNQSFTVNNPAPTLRRISPTSVSRGQTLNMVLIGNDFIDGVSTPSFGADITINSFTVNSDTQITSNITISPTATVGPRDVFVTNSSPGGGTSGTVLLSIVNNPPTPPILVSPANGDTVQLYTMPQSIRFVWKRSLDLDIQDTLRYSLFVRGPGLDTLISELMDTSINLDIMDSLKLASQYKWTVNVTDGIDIDSSDTFIFRTSDTRVNVSEKLSQIPIKYSLSQNYPNPFNPATTIRYGLPARSVVRVAIYNVLGQVVSELVNGEQDAGYYDVQ